MANTISRITRITKPLEVSERKHEIRKPARKKEESSKTTDRFDELIKEAMKSLNKS